MNLDQSLREAKAELLEVMRSGQASNCPCCGQTVKIYKRLLNSDICHSLILLWQAAGREYAHLPTVTGRNDGNAAKAKYWGLIEEADETREDGGRSGHWRLTDLGEQFVRGTATIPRYVFTYNSKVLGEDTETTTIFESLGDKFNYRQLMEVF